MIGDENRREEQSRCCGGGVVSFSLSGRARANALGRVDGERVGPHEWKWTTLVGRGRTIYR